MGRVYERTGEVIRDMKILVLHQFVNHNTLVNTLCKKLNATELKVDSFNISTWEYDSSRCNLPFLLRVLKVILFDYRLKLLVVQKVPFLLNGLLRRYDVVDIHFFGTFYYSTIDLLKKLGSKVKITVWGSDFYRASDIIREKQRDYYNKIDCIQIGTNAMKEDFVAYYQDFSDKIQLAHFGITQFDSIDKIAAAENIEDTKFKLKLPTDKRIVTCGYNGSAGQQHLSILDAVSKLDNSLKEQIFLLLPMTYGVTEEILNEVQDQLNLSGIEYLILTEDLTSEDVSRLRLATDIAINIQITDAFSASIQEHLYAQNVVIVGEWLPYNKLEENGVYYFKSSLDNLALYIEEAIINYPMKKQNSSINKAKMHQLSSWDAVTRDWVNLYSSIV